MKIVAEQVDKLLEMTAVKSGCIRKAIISAPRIAASISMAAVWGTSVIPAGGDRRVCSATVVWRPQRWVERGFWRIRTCGADGVAVGEEGFEGMHAHVTVPRLGLSDRFKGIVQCFNDRCQCNERAPQGFE